MYLPRKKVSTETLNISLESTWNKQHQNQHRGKKKIMMITKKFVCFNRGNHSSALSIHQGRIHYTSKGQWEGSAFYYDGCRDVINAHKLSYL